MLRLPLLVLYALTAAAALSALKQEQSLLHDTFQARHWNTPPHPDSTAQHVFSTALNLLNHWGNTYHRNGHSVVPVTVAPGTLLYHGRRHPPGPPGPPTARDWLTPDPAHALYFASSNGTLHTYTPTRPLRLLYFDGSSAAVTRYGGGQDAQDVILFGNVTWDNWEGGEGRWSPFERIGRLCEWAEREGYALDGFARMEFDFEIMYCNFTSPSPALRLLSSIPVLPAEGPLPSGWKGSGWRNWSLGYEAMAAGNLHNLAPVPGWRVDYAGLLSFYDEQCGSLVQRRRGQERGEHRLVNISQPDVRLFMRELDAVLRRPSSSEGKRQGSGLEWEGLLRHIAERYTDRLAFVQHLLHSAPSALSAPSNQQVRGIPGLPRPDPPADGSKGEDHSSVPQLVSDTRQQILTMLAPYISRSSFSSLPNGVPNSTWYSETHARCSGAHTAHLPEGGMTNPELRLKQAMHATHTEICRVLLQLFSTAYTAEPLPPSQQLELLHTWSRQVDSLMRWLDWPAWQACTPPCGRDEQCSLPQWPMDGVLNGTEPSGPGHCLKRVGWEPRGVWREGRPEGNFGRGG